ncbi:MAG: hypothetical protein WAM82_29595 [Thermoanaerobaculia bacterium]
MEQKRKLLKDQCGERLSAATREAMAKTAIVDAHSHTFSLAFLPVEGILYRFRVPAGAAAALAALLERLTDTSPLDQFSAGSLEDPLAALVGRLKPADLQELERYEGVLRKAQARNTRPQERGFAESLEDAAQRDPALGPLRPDDRRRVVLLLELLDQAGRGEDSAGARAEIAELRRAKASPESLGGRASGFLRMAALLTQREDRIAARLAADFPAVDLFVHHMMDLDHVYAGSSKFGLQARLKRAETLDALAGGRLRFGVAYDPFRPKDALDSVKEAIQGGAVSIKLYPPSGYRPSETVVPWRPGYFTSRFPFVYLPLSSRFHQRRQWDSRYGGGIRVIRDRIEQLVSLALGTNVPIFSHHTPQGFEAMASEGKGRDGYGSMMADPIYWKKVLEKHPQLRLILAHSGGGDAWFGGRAWSGSFGEHAYQLCTSYPNVYCDFGYSPEVLTTQGRQAFRKRLEELAASCAGGGCGVGGKPPYDIRDKILYGSDWYMVTQENKYQDFLCSFGEVFSGGILESSAAKFFGDNARRAFPLGK